MLESARGLHRYDYGNLVLEQVASDAGYTRGALYQQFKDKQEPTLAVIDWALETWRREAGRLVEQESDPVAALLAMARSRHGQDLAHPVNMRPTYPSGKEASVEENGGSKTQVHSDGTRRTFIEEGADERGEYLLVRSAIPQGGALPGPHWHPVLEQTFSVKEGVVRFRVDGRELVLDPGESVTVRPDQVHEFDNVGEGRLILVEEDRPPGRHREMFEFMHWLNVAGNSNARDVPTNPLLLGML